MDWIEYATPGDCTSGSWNKRCISGIDLDGGLTRILACSFPNSETCGSQDAPRSAYSFGSRRGSNPDELEVCLPGSEEMDTSCSRRRAEVKVDAEPSTGYPREVCKRK